MKRFTNIYWLLVMAIVFGILEFGFIAPALVSMQSNLGVSLGFASVILVIFFYLYVVLLVVKKSSPKIRDWVDDNITT